MNTPPELPLAQDPTSVDAARKRRPYAPPKLVDVGDVVELTRGQGGPYVDQFDGSQRPQ